MPDIFHFADFVFYFLNDLACLLTDVKQIKFHTLTEINYLSTNIVKMSVVSRYATVENYIYI